MSAMTDLLHKEPPTTTSMDGPQLHSHRLHVDEDHANACSDSAASPLTIALVMDTLGGKGNGTSNSAWQYAQELIRQGHHVRVVGLDSPQYPAQLHRIPLVSWVAAKQRMRFALPDEKLLRRAFEGADVVHIYMPFAFGRCACRVARAMHLPVTAGFHVQPENVTYSAGPLRYIPGISSGLYRLFRRWLYQDIAHIHVPSRMIAHQLRIHGYTSELHVISNGYSPRFSPLNDENIAAGRRAPLRIIASGRLAAEKDQITLIRAAAACTHAGDIELVIAGTGPLQRRLQREADRLLPGRCTIKFYANQEMPALLRSGDLFVHTSLVDIESLSVLEAMASGLVPVLAQSGLSAAGQFALLDASLFPARDVQTLSRRIDWWIDHPEQRRRWSRRYAEQTRRRYAIDVCVRQFVMMERDAIADHRALDRALAEEVDKAKTERSELVETSQLVER